MKCPWGEKSCRLLVSKQPLEICMYASGGNTVPGWKVEFDLGDDRGELQMVPLISCGIFTFHMSCALELAVPLTSYLVHYYYRFFIELEET